ncbi:MAG: hypothetical protein ACLTF6_06625 [Clostridium sp.]
MSCRRSATKIVNELIARDDVKNVHSSIGEYALAVVAVKVDPVCSFRGRTDCSPDRTPW